MSQPDTAQEILPVDMNWRHGTDFSPHPLPVEAEETIVSGIRPEDVPDPISDARFSGEKEDGGEESDDDEDAAPKGSLASGPAIEPASETPVTPTEF